MAPKRVADFIEADLREGLDNHRYSSKEPLPTILRTANLYRATPVTVAKPYRRLVKEGLIKKFRVRGRIRFYPADVTPVDESSDENPANIEYIINEMRDRLTGILAKEDYPNDVLEIRSLANKFEIRPIVMKRHVLPSLEAEGLLQFYVNSIYPGKDGMFEYYEWIKNTEFPDAENRTSLTKPDEKGGSAPARAFYRRMGRYGFLDRLFPDTDPSFIERGKLGGSRSRKQ
jgi:DNA-binding transcriptional regulator YhcF (GntR family)